jgi:hypothetical protein
MDIKFKIEYGEPALVLKVAGQEFEVGISTYDHIPMERLHELFLRGFRRLGYAAEEFDDEGKATAIAFRPAPGNKRNAVLVTLEEDGDAKGDGTWLPNSIVKDVELDVKELEEKYVAAFTDFIESTPQEKISSLRNDKYLAEDTFNRLTEKINLKRKKQ